MTPRQWLTAVTFTLAIVGALLLGGAEMNDELEKCRPLDPQPELAGAHYHRGIWTDSDYHVFGFAAEEDSPIFADADCVEQ